MISCPKCHFQQPADQFCAKCGVNMSTYKVKVPISNFFKKLIPLFLVILGIVCVAVLFKNVELEIQKNQDFTEIQADNSLPETKQIGVQASSLRQAADDKPQEIRNENKGATVVETKKVPELEKKEIAAAIAFSQVNVEYQLVEVSLVDTEGVDANKIWLVTDQVSIINTFLSEQTSLKKGQHTLMDSFDEPEAVLKLNARVQIDGISATDVNIKFGIRRSIVTPNVRGGDNSVSLSEKIPINKYLVVLDKLPRNIPNVTTSSILSGLMQSQLFLSQQTELAHVIRFQDPAQDTPEN